MNTGSVAGFRNVLEFGFLVSTKFLPTFVWRRLVERSTFGHAGAIAGLRRAPDSFFDLRYYSQATRLWIDTSDRLWLVRYRLVPKPGPNGELPSESGLPDERDQDAPWLRLRRADETRSPDYLRREFKARFAGRAAIELAFQAQFHELGTGDDLAWYDATIDWREPPPGGDHDPQWVHPWRDLGTLRLIQVLTDEEAERLEFNTANYPPTLAVPAARGVFDPRSLADSERRVIARLQKLRRWIYGAFGLPRFGNLGRKS